MTCPLPDCEDPATEAGVCEHHAAIEARAWNLHQMAREMDISEMRGVAAAEVKRPPRPPIQVPRTRGRSSYGRAALEGIARELAEAENGTRNNALNRAAFKVAALVAGGLVDELSAIRTLRGAAECLGLGAWEVKQTIRSGWLKGLENPRELATR